MNQEADSRKFLDQRKIWTVLLVMALAVLLSYCAKTVFAASLARASQNAQNSNRWIHVRVLNKEANAETVRVNVPLELAEKVLPTISHKNLHNGRVPIGGHIHDVDFRALLEAVRSSRDGEFVTVESKDNDVRVAKQAGYLIVHVVEHGREHLRRNHQVEVRMPLAVVDALLSGASNELDLVAGIRALATQPDMELVSVHDGENTVRVWLDSKNSAD